MTYLEKAVRDVSSMRGDERTIVRHLCPSDMGFMGADLCRQNDDLKGFKACEKCWNQKVPEGGGADG